MAKRVVFVPVTDPEQARLVHEHEVDFQWVPGRSAEMKRSNIAKLHAAAAHRNLQPLLEVSPHTGDAAATGLVSSNLTLKDENSYLVSLVSVYHGSKVFSGGGPFTDLYHRGEEEILGDGRLSNSGRFVGFRFMGLEWGLKSGSMFHDWLVLHAVHRSRKLSTEILRYLGFTDIDCRPGAADVCHARSCALYVALVKKKLIDEVIGNQDLFIETLVRDPDYQSGNRERA